jgi:hypothetical protein
LGREKRSNALTQLERKGATRADKITNGKELHVPQTSPTEGPLSLVQASKVLPEPWTEDKLRREVKAGRLRSVGLRQDPRIKRRRGRQAQIGIFLEDVRVLDRRTADIAALREQLAAKMAEHRAVLQEETAPKTTKKKSSVAATAPKQKGLGGDGAH